MYQGKWAPTTTGEKFARTTGRMTLNVMWRWLTSSSLLKACWSQAPIPRPHLPPPPVCTEGYPHKSGRPHSPPGAFLSPSACLAIAGRIARPWFAVSMSGIGCRLNGPLRSDRGSPSFVKDTSQLSTAGFILLGSACPPQHPPPPFLLLLLLLLLLRGLRKGTTPLLSPSLALSLSLYLSVSVSDFKFCTILRAYLNKPGLPAHPWYSRG